MSEETTKITLYGRIILNGEIEALTGLHIGGSPGALAIGGVDLPVIRNPIDQAPYIPGSSLKGKMRSLWEKLSGVEQNFYVNRTKGKEVRIHACDNEIDYQKCPFCQIYGTTGDGGASFPTRIVVRDAPLRESSMQNARTDLPYSEIKWEATIDRITSAATPRQIERVPAGAVFERMQIVFNIYEEADRERFADVLTALQLVEDDYLGGHGSRGSGRVAFRKLQLEARNRADYRAVKHYTEESIDDLAALVEKSDKVIAWITENIPINGGV